MRLIKKIFFKLFLNTEFFIKVLKFKNYLLGVKNNIPSSTYISSSAQIIGLKYFSIGNYSTIGDDVWININHRNTDGISIIVGDNCLIGRRVFISVEEQVHIKDYTTISINSMILGAHHDYSNPLKPYITSKVTGDPRITIGVNCFIAAGAIILAGVKIGHGSVIGAGTIVSRDIPPFSLAVGSPCKIIKNFDFEKRKWVKNSSNNKKIINIINEENYLEQLKIIFPKTGPNFYAATSKVGSN